MGVLVDQRVGAAALAALAFAAVAPARLSLATGEPSPGGRPAVLPLPAPSAPAPDRLRSRLESSVRERVPELGEAGAFRLASTILEESERAALDPVLMLAIIEVESGWDPDAVSSKGARGLMQLMSAALEVEARRGGDLVPTDPHDPFLNVRAGIRYYRRMLRTFKDADLALVAYNAGPARLAATLRDSGEVPDHLWFYPRRVRREERRLRQALDPRSDLLHPVAAVGR
jgi:soluble lytic murein transglycosylase-like protein